jgi:hypothetical protein
MTDFNDIPINTAEPRSDAWLRFEALAHAVAIHKAGAVAGVPPRGTVVELAEEYLAFLKGAAPAA